MNTLHPHRTQILTRVACPLLLTALLTLSPATALFAQEAPPAAVAFAELAASSQSIAQSVNGVRAQNGLPALNLHPLLNAAAQRHVDDMVLHGNWSHTGTDGSSVGQRVTRTGYPVDGWSSENWVSVSTPEKAMQWWMNSYVHRNNILNVNWSEFGVGRAIHPASGRTIFVLVFATGRAGEAPLVAAAAPAPIAAPVAEPVVSAAALAPAVAAAPAAPSVSLPSTDGVTTRSYMVGAGETLWVIAGKYRTTPEMLLALNNMTDGDLLQMGQLIQVPTEPTIAKAPSSTDASRNDSPSTVSAAASSKAADASYTVSAGDTLFSIAGKLGVTWQELAAANGLSGDGFLQIDQVLSVPSEITEAVGSSSAPVADPAAQATRVHVVASGDTIISIAVQYNVPWGELLRVNGLTQSSVLQPGQQISLP